MSKTIGNAAAGGQYVSFNVGQEEFGIDILKVQEIIREAELTKLPSAPAHVEGVLNLRGRIVPVIDLRRRFGLESQARAGEARIIVVELDGRVVGFRVDAVREVLHIDAAATEVPPELASGVDSDYIRAVAKLEGRLLILLDLERVLTSRDKEDLPLAA